MVRVSPVYGDTQTQGLVVGGHPRIVQGISGVRGYSDTGVGGGWTSKDCPGWSGYLWYTGILRRRGWWWVDIPGVSRMVWVSPVYMDTQTQGVVVGGHPRIVQDGLGISGVRVWPTISLEHITATVH